MRERASVAEQRASPTTAAHPSNTVSSAALVSSAPPTSFTPLVVPLGRDGRVSGETLPPLVNEMLRRTASLQPPPSSCRRNHSVVALAPHPAATTPPTISLYSPATSRPRRMRARPVATAPTRHSAALHRRACVRRLS